MIALRGKALSAPFEAPLPRSVWRLVDADTLNSQRGSRAFLVGDEDQAPEGFDLYLTRSEGPNRLDSAFVLRLPPELDYLSGDDVISVSDDGERIRVLWRNQSRQNSVLLTERCNHYCLMCSQPPKTANDDRLLAEAFELMRLLPRDTAEIGFTGGEPTLYGQGVIDLLRLCRNLHPEAEVHVLSNGTRFADPEFAAAWASIDNPNMMVGIPIYGAEPARHDYVVQAEGAFNQTIPGILNLAQLGQRTEIRVVLHKQTAPALPEIAEFIARNLPFVDQVALMGLEMIGLARANIPQLWIDPTDYADELTEAVTLLDRSRIHTMIYNHQLCLLPRAMWPYAVRSISDWKNEYHPECIECSVKDECGGFFFSAKYKVSEKIKAIPTEAAGREPALLNLG
ncbi:MAG TPA: His-Xaa-Ser system radical SAM maturase HxsC [Solirubrobacterales bacterium]|nr:His-Xaa-Ser system radical SAM maturase HxsC [Solirubrobacterales bacterium]